MIGALAVVSCGGKSAPPAKPEPPAKPVTVAADDSVCRSAYTEYEVEWRAARADELKDAMEGYDDLIEETIRTELLTTPTRAELTKLRDIYAVVDAFLWDAPWPRALKAADTAIEKCGENAVRPDLVAEAR